jgi:tRNA threonylcarbamoyl adenosine modification protein YeaZ
MNGANDTTLAIDCATEACSVALFHRGALIDARHRLLGRGHAEHLIPLIAELPGRGRAARIVVSLGPGSFTGVRIGIAAARALTIAWGAETLGYPTLALVGAMAAAESAHATVGVAMNGGHGEWFVQRFAAGGAPLGPHRSLSPQEAVRALPDEVIAGTQAEALVTLRGCGTALTMHPDASRLPLLANANFTAAIAPIYGRGPDARLPA